ncbi:MAG: repeat/DnaJ domain/tetratricopeptide repeat protein [Labilithrix sp.]|nr:repeat/DnaJ domain/tetratricopeptide repeat protein [Labilithrix sp.]
MVDPLPANPAPTAQGTFAKTPFSNLLIYALERALSGTFELHVGAASIATMLVIEGVPAKVRLTEEILHLGEILSELGLAAPEAIEASLGRMAESPRLQGQILLEIGAIDEARLDAGLRAQLERKLEHLFTLPPDTVFSYYDGVDSLQRYGGPPTPVDPLPVLWRGVRQNPAWEHVDATLRRVGAAAVRIAPNAQLDRFQFTRLEAGAIDLLRQRPLRIVELANAKVIGPTIAQLLVYVLVITKQVDLVEPASRPSQTQQAAVVAGPPSSAQAFARVQLQAKPVQRQPLIIEEAPAIRSAQDGRIASPLPQAIPLPDSAHAASPSVLPPPNPVIPEAPPTPVITGMPPADPAQPMFPLDIGSMITTTIASSMPPPLGASEYPPGMASVPPPPDSDQAQPLSQPPPSAPGGSLTNEQFGLKQKILDRSQQISAQDYFQMLGIERDATNEQIQKAFFGLAKVWHPDRLPAALVDVKDACSKVFTHLTEAQATLLDPERKAQYMMLLKDGGATPDDQAKIQAILEAATEFQKAEIYLKRNDVAQAHELARKAHALDPEQADYFAMVVWLDAQKPEWIGREKTLEKVALLDRCIKTNPNSERAYFWRGMLYKRADDPSKALKDFKRAAELNPRNLDAMREVRLFNMRGVQSKPPPGMGGAGRPSAKPPANEGLGGLFGKLFKK